MLVFKRTKIQKFIGGLYFGFLIKFKFKERAVIFSKIAEISSLLTEYNKFNYH